MALEGSILKSTKKALGLDVSNTAFDLDVITHINACFFTLNQLGVGPTDGYLIESETPLWADFLTGDPRLSLVKTYIYLKVRLLFDPPSTPHHLTACKEQITEFEHRLLM